MTQQLRVRVPSALVLPHKEVPVQLAQRVCYSTSTMGLSTIKYPSSLSGYRYLRLALQSNRPNKSQVYEYAITFDEEVAFLKKSKLNIVKIIYLVCRYLPFLFVAINTSPRIVIEVANLTVITCVDLMFLVRTYALWDRTRLALVIILVNSMALFIPIVGIVALFSSASTIVPVPGITSCSTSTTSQSRIIVWAYVLLVIGETEILLSTLYRSVQHYREVGGRSRLLTILVNHNAWYFGCSLTFLLDPYNDLLGRKQRQIHRDLKCRGNMADVGRRQAICWCPDLSLAFPALLATKRVPHSSCLRIGHIPNMFDIVSGVYGSMSADSMSSAGPKKASRQVPSARSPRSIRRISDMQSTRQKVIASLAREYWVTQVPPEQISMGNRRRRMTATDSELVVLFVVLKTGLQGQVGPGAGTKLRDMRASNSRAMTQQLQTCVVLIHKECKNYEGHILSL
ncbi:hypothetical protein BU15DRAFT_65286 [Melanogaster broomeanus]|nr:hypothetical protein BU15DRAFT_65286 [Melanogaster broomeanus]